MNLAPSPLASDQLRWKSCTQDIQDLIDLEKASNHTQSAPMYFTQPRALESVKMGLKIEAPGYHIFISGPTSSGKTSTIKSLLKTLQRPQYNRLRNNL